MTKYFALASYSNYNGPRTITELRNNGYSREEVSFLESRFKKPKPSEVTKLYFSKKSKYPRYKLREFTNIKKTLKVENADFIVHPRFYLKYMHNNFYSYNNCFKDFDNNVVYLATDGGVMNLFPKEKKKEACDTKFLCLLKEVYKASENTKPIGNLIFYKNIVDENLLDQIVTYKKSVISDEYLSKIVSTNLLKFDEENYQMIDDMLSSTDNSNVSLGLEMLTSYNYNENPFRVAFLLFKNLKSVRYNKSANSTAFQEMLSYLNLNKHLDSYSYHNVFEYIANINGKNACDEDINFSKEVVKKGIINILAELPYMGNGLFEKLGFDIKIDVEHRNGPIL